MQTEGAPGSWDPRPCREESEPSGAACKVSLAPQAEADPGPLDTQTEGVHVCRTQGPPGLDEGTADPRQHSPCLQVLRSAINRSPSHTSGDGVDTQWTAERKPFS